MNNRGLNAKIIILLTGAGFLGILGLVLKSAREISPPPSENKIKVAASFYPLYFFAGEIGKEKAMVKNITPAGAEPHDYEPTGENISFIEKSAIFIFNGGRFEPWAGKIRNNLNNLRGVRPVIVSPAEDLIADNDPHVWLSPPLAVKELEPIKNAFILVDPGNKTFYENNAEKLTDKLKELDNLYKQKLNNCQKKEIVTSHKAFSYLAKTYGFKEVPVAGLTPNEEPSPQKLAEVVKFVKNHKIKYVFFEKLASPKFSRTIARETGAQTLILDPIEDLSGEDLKSGKNYFTQMEANLDNLILALECR